MPCSRGQLKENNPVKKQTTGILKLKTSQNLRTNTQWIQKSLHHKIFGIKNKTVIITELTRTGKKLYQYSRNLSKSNINRYNKKNYNDFNTSKIKIRMKKIFADISKIYVQEVLSFIKKKN